MINGNGGVPAAQEALDRFFTEWEDTQRKLMRDQRNAIAFFVNEMVKGYQKAMADHIKRFDALRDENAALKRQLEVAKRQIDREAAKVSESVLNDSV